MFGELIIDEKFFYIEDNNFKPEKWIENKEEYRVDGTKYEEVIKKYLNNCNISSINEGIKSLQGKGDFIFNDINCPFDIKTSSIYDDSAAIAKPKIGQKDFYNKKIFLLAHVDKIKK